MLGLITVGITTKIIMLLINMIINIDEKETYIKRVKNCLIAFIVAICIFGIKELIEYYFT